MSASSATLLPPASRGSRALAGAGAVLAAVSVALAAYASHGADGEARTHLQTAAAFAFGHGLALCALAPQARRRFGRWALAGLLLGVLLFSGSLVAAHAFGWPTRLAPAGGSLMILAWLAYAVDAARR
ncbi:DUF423 domain-containing protein [Marilutibacter maris]|uniref:Membrane protein n=1 Tax=Marilutibacter maris TaxID=1605891 RepID=A0A2U9T4X1_9GAMM|nr:DUF423 domain-containing protein [Lysobacter maris]AWV07796.1 membrane protein [Lysobacter maris]